MTQALLGAGLLGMALPALSQTSPGNAPLDDLVVTATREAKDAFDIPASIDKINQDTLNSAGGFQVNLSETGYRVPGLVINNRNNFAQDLQISIRGFGARSTSGVRGVRLFSDGIPATMPDGSGQISHFSLSSAESIEVLRGPFSSLYGNSSGGVINITTRDPEPGQRLEAGLVFGSDHARKSTLQFNTGSENFGWVLDASQFETNGYRDHSQARRDNINSKMVFKLDSTKVTWVVNAVDIPEAQDPLGLTAAQLASNRRQAGTNAVASNSRKSVQQMQTGLVIDHSFNADTGLVFTPYSGERQIRQVVASGTVIDLNNDFYGADLRLRHRFALLGAPLLLNTGLTAGVLEQTRQGQSAENQPINRYEQNSARQLDQYVQAEWLFNEQWSLLAGLRNSSIDIESKDQFLTNGDGSGAKDYGKVTTNLGVNYYLSPTQNLYAAYGQGFETPTLLETAYQNVPGAPNFNPNLNASESQQYEVGYKARHGSTKVNAALYAVDTRDEIVVKSAAAGLTSFQNAGRTWRQGVELGLQHRFNAQWASALAANWITAEYKSSNTALTAGNALPSIPKQSLFGELTYQASEQLETAVEYRHIGRMYANDANTAQTDAADLLNWRITHNQSLGDGWRLRTYARVDNVLAQRYVGSVIVNQAQQQFYEPAAERQVLVGVSVTHRW
ncbi:TonB-dependent receptor [Limnobacter humi]|uniref:TonB-dependent receptor n=1 Tax=Limnobacter humi TaxID=1778671 RepID=A0ABT1WHH9_9BURK|nr:TonB-dependent receptor [Limnobacter humi]MCQ8896182.1 TonB-dependent receptor [Limnobacter humi]